MLYNRCRICILVSYAGAEEGSGRQYVGLWQPSGNEPANQPMVVRRGGGSDGSFRLSSSGTLLHRGQAYDLSLPHINTPINPPSASAEPVTMRSGAFLRAASDSSSSLDDVWELGDTEMDAGEGGGRERCTRTSGTGQPNADRLRCAFSPGDIIGCGVLCMEESSSTAPSAPSSMACKDNGGGRVGSSTTNTNASSSKQIVGVFFTINGSLGGFLAPGKLRERRKYTLR